MLYPPLILSLSISYDRTGAMDIQIKGCWVSNEECNRSQCVNNDPTLKKNVGFCCCNDDMCNQVHSWSPIIPEKAAESELSKMLFKFTAIENIINVNLFLKPFTDLTPYEEPTSPFWTVFLSFVCVLAAFVLVFLAIYLKKRKPTSFNEVPTVSKGYYDQILTFAINYLNIYLILPRWNRKWQARRSA